MAIDLIVQHIKLKLHQRGFDLRDRLLNQNANFENPDNLFKLPSTSHLRVRFLLFLFLWKIIFFSLIFFDKNKYYN